MQICGPMCGICGIVSWTSSPDESLVKNMCARLRHRGPDAEGSISYENVALGHTRLSIIDLRAESNQPMADNTSNYTITYNGEIYNYKSLRAELISLGHSFRTSSDTEVILNAYIQWGEKCLEKLNGMFAFAIWAKEKKSLFLARDRVGQKPLYFFENKQSLYFASELKALECCPEVSKEVNKSAIIQYLSLSYTLTSEAALSGVKKLPPGHYATFDERNGLEITNYWHLADKFAEKKRYKSISEATEELNYLLEDSVKLRLESDVPLGAFLSGGVDSSSIASAMCRLRPPSNNKTFCIGFDERGFSEVTESKEAASHMGVSHFSKTVDLNMAEALPQIAYYMDEPFADTSMIPMYFLSQFAREHVTVSLSGDGADEIFAGYETYVADKLRKYLSWLPAKTIRSFYSGVFARDFGKVSTDYKLRQFLAGLSLPQDDAHYFWREIFSSKEISNILTPEFQDLIKPAAPIHQFRKFAEEISPDVHFIDRAMYVDIKTWLVDDILVKVDRTSMAHSLEARSPFLDYRLIEFAASLPVEFKLKGLKKKYILRNSQKAYLPERTTARKKKGFNAPIAHWISSSLKPMCEDLLKSNMMQPDSVRKLLDDHTNKKEDNSFKLFTLIGLNLWLNRADKHV